jgi:WD40 repeat protein
VWDLEAWKEVKMLEGHTGWVRSVTVTPNNRYAITESLHELKVWDLETWQEVEIPEGYTKPITITPNSRYAISRSSDNTLRVWDLETWQEVKTLDGNTECVFSVTVTPDSRYAISGSSDNTLNIWNLETGEIAASFVAEGQLHACAIAPDGETVVTGSESGQVYFLRLEGL